MKKILFFISAFIVCYSTFGQTFINESFDATTFPPTGWTNVQVSGTGLYTRVTAGTYPTITTHTGAGMAKYDCYNYSSGTSAMLATPSFNLTGLGTSTAVVSFWMYRDNGYPTDGDSIDIYINTTSSLTGASHLGNINRARSLAPVEATDGWYKYSFNIPATYIGTTNYVIFKATSRYGNNIFIDDINIQVPNPKDLAATLIVAPNNGCGHTAATDVTLRITNAGTDPQNSYFAAYSLNGGLTYSTPENITATINAGATYDYTFTTKANIAAAGTYNIKAYIALSGDPNHLNDTITKSVVSIGNITTFPFIENFETGNSSYFDLTKNTYSNSSIQAAIGASASTGVSLEGGSSSTGWVGNTASNAWIDNVTHQASLVTCGVNATGLSGLILKFDLKQTSSYGLNYSWFRVLVNGTPLAEQGGTTDFNPTTAGADPFITRTYDLSAYANTTFVLTFQSSCKYNDAYYGGVADHAFIDNILLYEPVANDAGITAINAPTTPVAIGPTPVSVTIKNFGTAPLTSATIDWSVNGVLQPSYAYTNATGLATNATDGPIAIGSYNFTTLGNYIIKAWSVNPNGGTDGLHINDTISKSVYVQGYAALPFTENFDGVWIDKNDTKDVPSIYWINNPATSDQSWRRDDEGTTAIWTTTTGGYTPAGASSTTHSARFHSYDAASSATGTMDAFVDFTPIGTKLLKFWYINTSGTDSLAIWQSNDGGSTFSYLNKYTTASNWTEETVILGTSTAANTVIKFHTTSDYGLTDIGLDGVRIFVQQTNDVGVTALLNPKNSLCGKTLDSVSVVVENFGAAAQTNIPVKVNVSTPAGMVNLIDTLAGPLAANTIDTLYLGSINTTTPGNYVFTSYTTLTTDTNPANDTLKSTVVTTVPLAIPHLEDFESVTPLANWTTSTFTTGNGHGNASFVMYKNLYSTSASAIATMNKKVGLINNSSYLTFDYRVTNYTGGTATTLTGDSIRVLISSDCGSNFNTLFVIDQNNHTPAVTMKKVVLPLASYNGQNIIPGFSAKWATGDWYLDIDNVAISNAAVVNLGPDTAFCAGGSITLNAGASAIGYTYSYNWSTLAHPATIATTQNITADSTATYIVHVNNGYGVISSDTVIVGINPLPIVSLGPDVTKCGSSILDPGAGFTSYTWSTGVHTQTITVNTTNTYWVDVTNNYGCIARDSIHVTITPLPTVNAGPNQNECFTDTLHIINATAAHYDSLLWVTSGDGHFNDSTLLNPEYIRGANDITNGTVNLTLTAYAYCDTVSSMMVLTITSSTVAYAGADVTICSGENTQLSATGGTAYVWTPVTGLSNASISNPLANPTNTTTYVVNVTSSCGTATDDVVVTVDHITAPDLGPDSTVCAANSVLLDAGAGYDSYAWSGGQTTQTINVDTAGIGAGTFKYYVDVTKGTCSASDTIYITFSTCVGTIENSTDISIRIVPNPTNGIANIIVNSLNNSADLKIFTLQGQLMFSKKIAGNTITSIDFSSLPKGIYLVRIFNENASNLSKLVIQ
jgi:hypothetical protein